MSQTFKLFRLQQLDSQLDRGQARLNEIDAQLSQNEKLRAAEQNTAAAQSALQAAQKLLRQAEDQVRDQRVKIEQTEATLYGGKVRNPKELQDMQNEVAALKRFRSVLEDRQLETMIAVEEAEAQHAQAGAELEKVKAELNQQHAGLHEEQARLQREVKQLSDERQATAAGIPAADMELYNHLRKQRRGVAVAKVAGQACAACGSMLSAALLHAARSPNQITRCEACGRILYGG